MCENVTFTQVLKRRTHKGVKSLPSNKCEQVTLTQV